MPPSKRITTSATTPIRSTVRIEMSPSDGKASESERRGDQEERRPGHAKPLAHPARDHCEREPGRDEQHDQSELVDLVHPPTLSAPPGPYISLTFR